MDICNPNKEANRDFVQKVIDSVVGVPAKCGTKYKGGKEMDIVLDLKSRLEEAIATRQSFEDQAKRKCLMLIRNKSKTLTIKLIRLLML